MSGKGDEALSNKLGHLLDATADPAKITGSAKFQGALSEGRQLCQVAKNDLDQAVADSDADEIENATTARTFELALKAVLAELTYVWKKSKDRLLNLAPEEREELDEVEYLRREEFFAVNLDVPPSYFNHIARSAARSKLLTRCSRLLDNPEYFPPEAVANLNRKVATLNDAYQQEVAEELDNTPLQNALEAAGAEGESKHSAGRGYSPLREQPLLRRRVYPSRYPLDLCRRTHRPGNPG